MAAKTNYLFEGDETGQPYSTCSSQITFHNAKQKTGISKIISFHGLRDSFATGGINIKTTNRYLNVKRETLVNIVSPLDTFYGKD